MTFAEVAAAASTRHAYCERVSGCTLCEETVATASRYAAAN
eukprot:CAMPEP_0119391994 /NCGR_PEP_ID=MMETSP1334-20130426/119458_1 /TAXON_ID=127549 /ORGANISM="Calcidiscus leptoporus, Strain RCC1130" /LENGTH=40 /DNA_ID= /DNA_START= /DNA_END= /DNA_ORIENTATION=